MEGPRSLRDILDRLRKLDIDEIEISSDGTVEYLDVAESIRTGKIVTNKEAKKDEKDD